MSAFAVNTSDGAPTPFGTYDPDGVAPGAYVTASDIASEAIGCPFNIIQRSLNDYASILFPDIIDPNTKKASIALWLSNHVVPECESEADVFLRQTLKPTQVTRYFDGTGTQRMTLPFTPILKIVECQIFAIPSVKFVSLTNPQFVEGLGDLDSIDYYQSSDLLVDPRTGELVIPARVLYADSFTIPLWNYTFLPGDKNIKVSWTYGFEGPQAVPESFRRGVAKLGAIRCFEAAGTIDGQGRAHVQVANSAKMFGREKNLPYSDRIAKLQKDAIHLLNPYRYVG